MFDFSTYFYYLVRFTKINHFSLSLSIYIYIYIYIIYIYIYKGPSSLEISSRCELLDNLHRLVYSGWKKVCEGAAILLGLVSFSNGMSTFLCYLMPKPPLWKNSSDTIWPIAERIRRFISFPRVLVWKWTL